MIYYHSYLYPFSIVHSISVYSGALTEHRLKVRFQMEVHVYFERRNERQNYERINTQCYRKETE